jgi:hypothetical protein
MFRCFPVRNLGEFYVCVRDWNLWVWIKIFANFWLGCHSRKMFKKLEPKFCICVRESIPVGNWRNFIFTPIGSIHVHTRKIFLNFRLGGFGRKHKFPHFVCVYPIRNWRKFIVTPKGSIPVHTHKFLPIFLLGTRFEPISAHVKKETSVYWI